MAGEAHYNKGSVTFRRVLPRPDKDFDNEPGDFCWDFDAAYLGGKREGQTHVLYLCLPGEIRWSPIHVQKGGPGGERVWGWDGNEDLPTVQPSIHWVDHWHGFLTAGRLVSCP